MRGEDEGGDLGRGLEGGDSGTGSGRPEVDGLIPGSSSCGQERGLPWRPGEGLEREEKMMKREVRRREGRRGEGEERTNFDGSGVVSLGPSSVDARSFSSG